MDRHIASLVDTTETIDTVRLSEIVPSMSNLEAPVNPVPFPHPTSSLDFARLVPVNDQAKLAFHRVALLLIADPSWNPHCRKYVHISSVTGKVTTGRSMESDSSDGENEDQEIHTGYFRLSLALLPDKFAQGYVIGAGRAGLDHLGVDFLVTTTGSKDGVRGRHASIRWHLVSRLLMIVPAARKQVILNGDEVPRQGRVLGSPQMGLTIGNLAFSMEFLPINATIYKQRLDQIIQESGARFTESVESIDLTPLENHITLKGYQIQAPQAAGAYGTVSPCVQISSGIVYAVKRIQRTRASFNQVGDEIVILQRLNKHPHVCTLIKAIYSDGDGSSMGQSMVNDVYLVLEPWAPKTLWSLVSLRERFSLRLQAFFQSIQGVRYIHSCGIIHRDLKLDNILIAQLSPLRVVVTDFGHATTATENRDHLKGTISYLPPEILALKKTSKEEKAIPLDSHQCWTRKCDVYSLGLVGMELFHGYFKRPSTGVDKIQHDGLLGTLQKHRTSADSVIETMLNWEPRLRPEISDVLLNPIWPESQSLSTAKKRYLSTD